VSQICSLCSVGAKSGVVRALAGDSSLLNGAESSSPGRLGPPPRARGLPPIEVKSITTTGLVWPCLCLRRRRPCSRCRVLAALRWLAGWRVVGSSRRAGQQCATTTSTHWRHHAADGRQTRFLSTHRDLPTHEHTLERFVRHTSCQTTVNRSMSASGWPLTRSLSRPLLVGRVILLQTSEREKKHEKRHSMTAGFEPARANPFG
jgi:hypothetical protein